MKCYCIKCNKQFQSEGGLWKHLIGGKDKHLNSFVRKFDKDGKHNCDLDCQFTKYVSACKYCKSCHRTECFHNCPFKSASPTPNLMTIAKKELGTENTQISVDVAFEYLKVLHRNVKDQRKFEEVIFKSHMLALERNKNEKRSVNIFAHFRNTVELSNEKLDQFFKEWKKNIPKNCKKASSQYTRRNLTNLLVPPYEILKSDDRIVAVSANGGKAIEFIVNSIFEIFKFYSNQSNSSSLSNSYILKKKEGKLNIDGSLKKNIPFSTCTFGFTDVDYVQSRQNCFPLFVSIGTEKDNQKLHNEMWQKLTTELESKDIKSSKKEQIKFLDIKFETDDSDSDSDSDSDFDSEDSGEEVASLRESYETRSRWEFGNLEFGENEFDDDNDADFNPDDSYVNYILVEEVTEIEDKSKDTNTKSFPANYIHPKKKNETQHN